MSVWINGVTKIMVTISEILTAGIAVTAFSLLLYALSFNLKNRVARSFAAILLCEVIVFSCEALGSTAVGADSINFWLHAQWVGIVFLPAAYLHFSDALLSTTGRPSRWRRRWAVRIAYLISIFLLILIPTDLFLGKVIIDRPPAPYNQPTLLTEAFIFLLHFHHDPGVDQFYPCSQTNRHSHQPQTHDLSGCQRFSSCAGIVPVFALQFHVRFTAALYFLDGLHSG